MFSYCHIFHIYRQMGDWVRDGHRLGNSPGKILVYICCVLSGLLSQDFIGHKIENCDWFLKISTCLSLDLTLMKVSDLIELLAGGSYQNVINEYLRKQELERLQFWCQNKYWIIRLLGIFLLTHIWQRGQHYFDKGLFVHFYELIWTTYSFFHWLKSGEGYKTDRGGFTATSAFIWT